uniref:Axonemal dynein light intermediate polypeptide 1 n=1 Tax=Cyanistes caeruleus TaxID=156563 RepID=A0A8C0USP2_CYACU
HLRTPPATFTLFHPTQKVRLLRVPGAAAQGTGKRISCCSLCCSSADELIRQTTVSCAERGLLLLRVRDELQLTLAAYQALYESSVAFGVRKALQAEQGKAHLEERIAELEEEKKELEKQVSEEKAKCEAIEKQETERREIEEKKHSEEVLFLKRTNQQLKAQLECIIAAKN